MSTFCNIAVIDHTHHTTIVPTHTIPHHSHGTSCKVGRVVMGVFVLNFILIFNFNFKIKLGGVSKFKFKVGGVAKIESKGGGGTYYAFLYY